MPFGRIVVGLYDPAHLDAVRAFDDYSVPRPYGSLQFRDDPPARFGPSSPR